MSAPLNFYTPKVGGGLATFKGSEITLRTSDPIKLIEDTEIEDIPTDDPFVLISSLWPYVSAGLFLVNISLYYVVVKKVMDPKKYLKRIKADRNLVNLIRAAGVDENDLNSLAAKRMLVKNVKTIDDIQTLQKSTMNQHIKNALFFNSLIKFLVFITIGLRMWDILHKTSGTMIAQTVAADRKDTDLYIQTIVLNAYLQLKVLPLIFQGLTKLALIVVKGKVPALAGRNNLKLAEPALAGVGSICASRLLTSYVTPEVLQSLRFNLVTVVQTIMPADRFTPEQLLKMQTTSSGISKILKQMIGISSPAKTPLDVILAQQSRLTEFIITTQKALLESFSIIRFAAIMTAGVTVSELLVALADVCSKKNNIPNKVTPLAINNKNNARN
jgi:hypothetical protein